MDHIFALRVDNLPPAPTDLRGPEARAFWIERKLDTTFSAYCA